MAATDVEARAANKTQTVIQRLRATADGLAAGLAGTSAPFDPTANQAFTDGPVSSLGGDPHDTNAVPNAIGVSPGASWSGGSVPGLALLSGTSGGSSGLLSSPVIIVGLILGALVLLPRILRRG